MRSRMSEITIAESRKPKKWGILILITSTTTLVCCAIPILLVSLGMGAVVASITSNMPFLVTLSHYKTLTFTMTALILAAAGWMLYRPGRSCPVEPELAAACNNVHKWNIRFFWGSVTIWFIGAFSAFILPVIAV